MKLLPEVQPAENPIQILLVDDDLSLLKLLSLRLESAGHQVITAASGEEALLRLQECTPDLVLSDLRMDEMDGLALFAVIQEQHPSLPVIILTAHGTIPDAIEATRQGVYGFLTKPVDKQELFQLIDEVSQQSARPRQQPNWHPELIAASNHLLDLLRQAEKAAEAEAPLLITGSPGTGKTLLATSLQQATPLSASLTLNCNQELTEALEEQLFEFLEATQQGWLLIEAIDLLPASLQARLQARLKHRPAGLRLITTSRCSAPKLLEDKKLTEDLYYQLAVIQLHLPDLSERSEDLPVLINHYLQLSAQHLGKQVSGFSAEAMQLLAAAPWPGNVRQLVQVIEQCVTLTTTPVISSNQVASALNKQTRSLPSLNEAKTEFEKNYLIKVLQLAEGKVTEAARLAGRNRTDFYKLLNKHQLEPARFKEEAKRQKES